jgi:hypothetical protein
MGCIRLYGRGRVATRTDRQVMDVYPAERPHRSESLVSVPPWCGVELEDVALTAIAAHDGHEVVSPPRAGVVGSSPPGPDESASPGDPLSSERIDTGGGRPMAGGKIEGVRLDIELERSVNERGSGRARGLPRPGGG